MRLSQTLLILAASAVGTVQAEKALEDYKVWIPQWDFEVTPSGDHVVLNGTVEQVVEQLRESNPKLMVSFNLSGKDGQEITALGENVPALPLSLFRTQCHAFRPGAVVSWAAGIRYLEAVPGKPANGPGPGECGRVSCSYNTQIWWCNEDTKTKTLASFRHIADGARAAYMDCTDNQFYINYASGKAIHKTDNWNVVVRGRNKGEDLC
ncbi:hypothetical protein CMUS01_14989 [Colletotrichum musicola]|uniref:Secreted protein n=1 Tax=Colletotrichum musicola TaxID=2175873 RepID=A0A8H6MPU1_9PEZI|nr:hypothetical protein CMUS01_14989 [Colletotrichum musicola]